MKTVASFFGTRADEVLTLYRRAATDAHAVQQLAARLRGLREERDELHRRHDPEIAERTVKLAELEANLEQATKKADALDSLRDRLTLSLSSFWRRLGISIRRLFSSDALSVNELRDRLRDVLRSARRAQEKIEKLTRTRSKQVAALRHLTIPLESVEYAISFLEQVQRSCRSQLQSYRSAIDDEIHATVRASSLLLLRSKLKILPPTVEQRPLAIRVMRLKYLLTLLELPDDSNEVTTAELGGDPLQRLVNAVNQGFYAATGKAHGRLSLRGSGHKHVQRTRTRSIASSRRRHGSLSRSRTETYWDRVSISLVGQLSVNLEIRYPGWRPDPVIDALRDEAQAWFRTGAMRRASETTTEELSRARREVAELTEEIREILESGASSNA